MDIIKEVQDTLRQTFSEIDFSKPQKPIISKKETNSFKDIGLADKLVLLSAIGISEYDRDEIDSILEKRIKDYSINYSTGDVEIQYKEPIEYVTIELNLDKED